jgi:hypothetical protein
LALAESADGEPEVHAQLALLYSMKQDTHSTIEHVNKVFLLGAQEEQLSSAFLRSAVWFVNVIAEQLYYYAGSVGG